MPRKAYTKRNFVEIYYVFFKDRLRLRRSEIVGVETTTPKIAGVEIDVRPTPRNPGPESDFVKHYSDLEISMKPLIVEQK